MATPRPVPMLLPLPPPRRGGRWRQVVQTSRMEHLQKTKGKRQKHENSRKHPRGYRLRMNWSAGRKISDQSRCAEPPRGSRSTVSVVNSDRLSGTSTTPARLAATGRPLRSGDAVDRDGAGRGREQPGQGEQQGGLAGAVGAEQREHAARPPRRGRGRGTPRWPAACRPARSAGAGASARPRRAVGGRSPSVGVVHAAEVGVGDGRSARITAGGPSAMTAPKSST